MEYYECNEKLQLIIENQGFFEVSTERDKITGRKEFKNSGPSKFKICFNRINFTFFEGSAANSGLEGSKISYDELKLLFWYIKSTGSDRKQICSGKFNLSQASAALSRIRQDLFFLQKNSFQLRTVGKLKRLIGNYEIIQLN